MILCSCIGYGFMAYKLDTDYININDKKQVEDFIADYLSRHKGYDIIKFKDIKEYNNYLDSYTK